MINVYFIWKKTELEIGFGLQSNNTVDPKGEVGIGFNWLGRIVWQILVSKGKAIPLKVWTGPECSRTLRLPDFKTIGT